VAIDELLAVIPPPENPIDAGTLERWPSVIERVGIALPDDLRDIGIHYGSGRFANGEIQIFNPFAEGYTTLVECECQILRDLRGADPEEVPFGIYPERSGLFPWGRDYNGNTMLWLTNGDPNEWTIVLAAEEGGYEHWDLPLATFLAKVFTHQIKCVIWPLFPANQRNFKPKARP
jgi:hypothetical protein